MKLIRSAPTESAPGAVHVVSDGTRQYSRVDLELQQRRTTGYFRRPADWKRPSTKLPARCTKLIAAIDAAIERGVAS